MMITSKVLNSPNCFNVNVENNYPDNSSDSSSMLV